ncbi:hypothetical protein L211DRAFT_859235 [Terfezia boudieri ATCC MYA-4762]|uniref:protein-tyrosine-phosphatase n=1 Tax=Terfezia boudieri ATCC MYA-4762 TaxID=1051890 RepID=A0A3N4L7T2_9PEZI|nr:hypothetical protein L211DRAFT_859235 [Terfezia boudieri ATCC MYA-4762]
MLLDLRSYLRYSTSRIQGAIHLCIPTTLRKRSSFNLQKLSETFINEIDKDRFARWKEAKYIIVYDTNSHSSMEATSAADTVNKFVKEGWRGHAYCIKGGFVAFAAAHPEKIDYSNVLPPGLPQCISVIRGGGSSEPGSSALRGGFKCPNPAQASPVTTSFTEIRQNMDLIGGVGEIPVSIPAVLQSEGRQSLPTWLKILVSEDSAKLISERFLAIGEAEKERMEKALDHTSSFLEPTKLACLEKGQENWYNNIWQYDATRVNPVGSCDYINASYIKSSRSAKRYIATQGPLPSTFQDFWSVVWDQDVRVIVLLTAESEGGHVNCHPYWVDGRYGSLVLMKKWERRVSLQQNYPNGSSVPHMIVRGFALQNDNQPFHQMREIIQLQFASWPDFGTPAYPAHILALIEYTYAAVKSTGSQKPGITSKMPLSLLNASEQVERPVVVHCSAGYDRTGTFCCVDIVINMILRQQIHQQSDKEWMDRDDEDLICQVVSGFRKQRLPMVQNLTQFVLCYDTVLEWISRQKPLVWGKRKA